MFRRLFSVQNLIFVGLIALFIIIIAGQQDTLNEKKDAYYEAAAVSAENEEAQAAFELEQSLDDTETSEEDAARNGGYVYDDEFIFTYN